eukprot:gb/GFBE01009459.1/.p1 GENE.gb/GFBE01009459.1/~~gb/GFBE01009459.1/.p1  ORF type:complete len:181 (+),score=57.31 gb/GFBE01009459.1/:1-543(+)
MLDTKFKTPLRGLVPAAELSIGDMVLDHTGNVRAVTWCRRLPKKKRLCVDLHSKPLTVTSSHRVVVPGPGGEVLAKDLHERDEVLIGSECQQLVKVTKYHKVREVMELEFEGDAIIEVHSPSILTKGSDPSMPIDQDGGFKCKLEEEMETEPGTATGSGTADQSDGVTEQSWPDTDDDLR